jgi:hypothetical protein
MAPLLAGVALATATLITPIKDLRLDIVSPVQPVAVVELFTSQGCNSCPPADAWLSGLARRPDLWRTFVPLAWHVDYWDDLGWRDRFSRPESGARQRAYRDQGRLQVVYTPGVMVSGREWRTWPGAEVPPTGARSELGRLRLRLTASHAEISLSPSPGLAVEGLRAHLALLGMGMQTQVARGENSGRTLSEDFVVLSHQVALPLPSQAPPHWGLTLPTPTVSAPGGYAVAAWVSRGNDPTPLQAVGGWLR